MTVGRAEGTAEIAPTAAADGGFRVRRERHGEGAMRLRFVCGAEGGAR
ncbi:hypothetical protein OG589_05465 [Sphaerisporangium sp. NBC_01403]